MHAPDGVGLGHVDGEVAGPGTPPAAEPPPVPATLAIGLAVPLTEPIPLPHHGLDAGPIRASDDGLGTGPTVLPQVGPGTGPIQLPDIESVEGATLDEGFTVEASGPTHDAGDPADQAAVAELGAAPAPTRASTADTGATDGWEMVAGAAAARRQRRDAVPVVPALRTRNEGLPRRPRSLAIFAVAAAVMVGAAATFLLDSGQGQVATIPVTPSAQSVTSSGAPPSPSGSAAASTAGTPSGTSPTVGSSSAASTRTTTGRGTPAAPAVRPTAAQATADPTIGLTTPPVTGDPAGSPRTPQAAPSPKPAAARPPAAPRLGLDWASDGSVGVRATGVRPGDAPLSSITVSGDGVSGQATPVAGVQSYQMRLEGLAPGRSYRLTARVCDAASQCASSNALEVQADREPTPGSVQLAAIGNTLFLYWDGGTAAADAPGTCRITINGLGASWTAALRESGSRSVPAVPGRIYSATKVCEVGPFIVQATSRSVTI